MAKFVQQPQGSQMGLHIHITSVTPAPSEPFTNIEVAKRPFCCSAVAVCNSLPCSKVTQS